MDIFAALAVPARRDIVALLAQHGRLQAAHISEHFKLTPSAISQHLKILREAGFIKVEKQAQRRMYEINPAAFAELEKWLGNTRQLWSNRLDYLDELVKAEGRHAK